MKNGSDAIPIVETYKGVGIHDRQPPDRIAAIVKPEIDFVIDQSDASRLVDYCADHTKPPEARLLAAAKLHAMHELAANDHRTRAAVDLEFVAACVAGLESQRWRSSTYYGSILDPGPAPGEHRLQRPAAYRWER